MYGIIAAVLVILSVLWFRWRKRNISIFSDLGIPGPQPSLLFGNVIELYRKGPLKCHEEWVEKYGRIVGYYYGMRPILLVADPQLLKSILIKDFSKFVDRAPFNQLYDLYESDDKPHSINTSRGQQWKKIRSVLTPSFTTAKMKKIAVNMNSSMDAMVGVMRKKAKTSKEFDIHDVFQRLTMDVIAKLAFGVVTDVQTDPQSRLLQTSQVFFNIKYKDIMVLTGLCFPSLKWMMLKLQRMHAALLNRGSSPISKLKEGMTGVIQLRRNHPETKKPDLIQMMLDTKIKVEKNQAIDLMKLEAGNDNEEDDPGNKEETTNVAVKNLTEKEITDTSISVFLAGYETTSTALSFTSYLLAKHPEVQNRVFEEVHGLIKNDEKLEYNSINKLPYLDQVLNESLRIYPPVYLFVNRHALEDVYYGAIRIPKRMQVLAPVYLLHHDPEYWPDPEVFDPERFKVKPNSDGITYLPFGVGPRNCIGMRFAQMEAKLALAHMIYNFHLEISPSQENELPVTLRMQTLSLTGGVRVKLYPREHQSQLVN